MIRCSCCGTHVRPDTTCPHCGAAASASTRKAVAAALLGLTMVGPACQSMYGLAVTDRKGGDDTALLDADADGWSTADGDCDDDDADVHPEATETVGDGVDSNCDGEDDT